MATIDELKDALMKAHTAGEKDHARILANEIVKMQGASAAPRPSMEENAGAAMPAAAAAAPSMEENVGAIMPAPAAYRPTRAPSSASAMSQGNALNYFSDAAGNAPRDIYNVAQGISHAVEHLPTTINNLGDIAAGGVQAGANMMLPKGAMDYLNSSDPQGSARAAEAWEAFKQHYVDNYGTLEGAAESFRQRPVSTLMDASMVFGGGAALARGARAPNVANALSTAESFTNPINAFRPVGMLAEATPGYVARIFNPKNEAYLKAAEGNAPAIIGALETNKPATPGATFTAAEAAADTSGTMFPALQEKVKPYAATAYADQAAANEAARTGAVGTFAKTPEELQSAIATRSANAEAGYGKAGKEQFIADAALEDLINKSPSIEDAIRQATRIGLDAEARGGTPFTLERGTPAVEAAPGKIMPAPGGSRLKRVQGPATEAAEAVPTTASGADLHTVQLALKDMMAESPGGIKGFASKEIGLVRKQLTKWLEDNSERYAAVKQKFIEDSKPINEMQIGQQLQKDLRGELGVGEQRAGKFDASVENAPATITNAIGAPIFKTLDAAIGPENTAIVKGIQQDLAREALARRRAGEGGGRGLDVPDMPGSVRPGVNWMTDAAERIYRALSGRVSRATAEAIAKEMVSPTATAEALKKALSYEQSKNAFTRGAQAATTTSNAMTRGGVVANEPDRQREMYRP